MATELEVLSAILQNAHPCVSCPMPCRDACPTAAFSSGSYCRDACKQQMTENEAHPELEDGILLIKYCRACELACKNAPKC